MYTYLKNSKFHTLGRLGIPGVTLQNLLISPLSRYNKRNVWIDIPHASVASWFGISWKPQLRLKGYRKTKIVGCERGENCWMIFEMNIVSALMSSSYDHFVFKHLPAMELRFLNRSGLGREGLSAFKGQALEPRDAGLSPFGAVSGVSPKKNALTSV